MDQEHSVGVGQGRLKAVDPQRSSHQIQFGRFENRPKSTTREKLPSQLQSLAYRAGLPRGIVDERHPAERPADLKIVRRPLIVFKGVSDLDT